MEQLFIYLLKSGLAAGMIYLFHRLLLQKETHFAFNRFFLLTGAILSAVLPLMGLNFLTESNKVIGSIAGPVEYLRPVIITAGVRHQASARTGMTAENIPAIIYCTVSALVFCRLVFRLWQIQKLKRESHKVKSGTYKIYELNEETGHFSFFNSIFIGRNRLAPNESEQVIRHEMVHSAQRHALDIIIMEAVLVFQWFNPFFWLIKKAIIETHEFIADSVVIKSGYKASDYKNLLYNQITGRNLFALSNQFSKKQIKRRLTMMTKSPSTRLSLLKYWLILPLAGLIILFACKPGSDQPINTGGTEIFQGQPEKYPEPAQGWASMWQYLESNTRMPESAREHKLTAKFNVGFVVEADGSVSNVQILNAKRAEDKNWSKSIPDYGCDEEAVRLVKNMPPWKPAIDKGKPVRMNRFLPVLFGDQQVWDAKNPYSIQVEPVLTAERKENLKKLKKSDINRSGNEPSADHFSYSIPEFIAKHINYPESAKKNNISGTVYVSFVIDENGYITDIKIDKGINKEFDDEVIRVMKLVKPVMPTIGDDGKPMKYKLTIPVTFRLE